MEFLDRSVSTLRAALLSHTKKITVCSELLAVLADLVNEAFLHLFEIFVRRCLGSLKARNFRRIIVSQIHELLVSDLAILRSFFNAADVWEQYTFTLLLVEPRGLVLLRGTFRKHAR